MEWKNVQINAQNIEFDSGRATLIKMPNNSNYEGYKFWHPSKLVRSGNNEYSVTLSYTDDFTFKLFKNGKGKYNKNKKIAEEEIDVEEFEDIFECMKDCTRKKEKEDSYLIITEPQKIEIGNVEIEETLKNE